VRVQGNSVRDQVYTPEIAVNRGVLKPIVAVNGDFSTPFRRLEDHCAKPMRIPASGGVESAKQLVGDAGERIKRVEERTRETCAGRSGTCAEPFSRSSPKPLGKREAIGDSLSRLNERGPS